MASQPQIQATAFQLALHKFKTSLSDNEKRQFGATTLHDLNIAIETIQQKQRSEKKLRAMGKLGRFLEGMKEYDKIVTVFLNTSELLAFVWVRIHHTVTRFCINSCYTGVAAACLCSLQSQGMNCASVWMRS